MERYEAAKASYDSIIAQIAEEHKRVQRMQAFIRNVRELGVITEFDETHWGLLVSCGWLPHGISSPFLLL